MVPGRHCTLSPVAWPPADPLSWTTSTSSWPNDGEIDIVEGVNQQVTNQISLHTGDNCSMNQASNGSIGTLGSTDCASATNPAGCSLTDKSPGSYGEPFNAGQGGVYAMEWTSQAISVWWWARRDIPADVRSGAPQPATWATPVARFQGSCDIDSHFKDHQIVRSPPTPARPGLAATADMHLIDLRHHLLRRLGRPSRSVGRLVRGQVRIVVQCLCDGQHRWLQTGLLGDSIGQGLSGRLSVSARWHVEPVCSLCLRPHYADLD